MDTAAPDQPSPLRADARRNIELILDAAETCLARDADASMGEIAAEAGLGRVTVYGHFKSRPLLVEAVARRALAAADDALGAVDLTGDAAEALERLVAATWQVTLRSGSVIVAAEKALPPATVREMHAGGLEDRVRAFVTAAQGTGEFRTDLTADWLIAVFHAVLHAAAVEIDAGRMQHGDAATAITATLGAALRPPGPRA